MSKKILAIALFAVMVLSLVPVASAAANFGPIANIDIYMASADGGDVSTLYSEYAWDSSGTKLGGYSVAGTSPARRVEVGGMAFAGIIAAKEIPVITGRYDDLAKIETNSFLTGKAALYRMDIWLDTWESGDVVRVNGSVVEPLSDGEASPKFYVPVYFEAEKGGNTKSYKIEQRYVGGSTATYDLSLQYRDTSPTQSDKPTRAMDVTFKPVVDGISGRGGDYNAYMTGGVLFIDVASDLPLLYQDATGYPQESSAGEWIAVPMDLAFTVGGAKFPVDGQIAIFDGDTTASGWDSDKSTMVKPDKFFVEGPNGKFHSGYDTRSGWNSVDGPYTDKLIETNQVKYDTNERVWFWLNRKSLTTAANSVKIVLESKDFMNATASIPVRTRIVPRNEITMAKIEASMNLVIGEKKTLDIQAMNISTYRPGDVLRLRAISPVNQTSVLIDGFDLTGLNVGETTLILESYYNNDNWTAVGYVNVTVTAAGTTAPPPVVGGGNSYRVITRNLNVRSGPGTGFGTVGQVHMNEVYTGTPDVAGWLKIGEGRYVSMQYVTPVSGVTSGNYITTASSLNVRTAPNGSVTTKYAKGTPVTVTTVSNGWAQLDNGLWVSMLYLAAR